MKLKRHHIIVRNQAHSEAVQKRAFELGWQWGCGGQTVQRYIECSIYFNRDKILSYGSVTIDPEPPSDQITLDDLYEPPFTKTESVTVTLNVNHEAVITKKDITVGCQTFPLSVIDELVKARAEVLS